MTTGQPLRRRLSGLYRALLPVAVAVYVVGMFAFLVPMWLEPNGPALPALGAGLTQAQQYTLDSVKQLNSFLISTTTLMFGWVGWYLSQYRPSTVAPVTRAIFFSVVGFLSLAFWYAAQTYAETTTELAQNVLGITPGESRILFYLQLEFAVCAVASVLILLVFADAVTRRAPRNASAGTP
jgi:hypothetical protein